jgi:multiple sugar transport system substrate-binding protein
MEKIIIKGITWGHSRGISPLLAFSQRFSELNPGVEVQWTKRSLQEFADFPIEKLTEQYDLLIIDHPWVGCAAATNCVLPLESYLPKDYLQDQLDNSVGQSHQSYHYNGHQWALAIDAATPAASYRPDLFEKNNISLPLVWDDLIELARKGKVAVPAIPIDLLMNFYMFCIASGTTPFLNEEEVVNLESGNPIGVAELMSSSDDYLYCPFAYCYSNYSRAGFSDKMLKYADMVSLNNQRLKSTIGGTGLAVSAFSQHKDMALAFLTSIVSPKCQSTFYVENGGQAGHKSAWMSEQNNLLCNDFFSTLLPVMENGFIRPRYNGYLYFQDHAGILIQDFILNKRALENVLSEINKLYIKSLSFTNK